VTHAHFDHVGAIPQLLKVYPQASVVVHSKEAPFLTGQHPPGQQPYSSRSAALLRLLQTAAVVPRGPITARLAAQRQPLLSAG
jgi:glyoxylase-like metal-dependent hydrolase (beta-lactamase superfamily II)